MQFYFLLEIDLDYKKYIYHNSPELINQTIKEINEKFLGSEKRLLDARLDKDILENKYYQELITV